jgi:bacillithiol biosynthesis deacetylase BshB1
VASVTDLAFPGALPPEAAFPLDLLAVAPHPDDAELGMGGTLRLHARAGWRVGILDLTRGELGTNGTPEERLAESAQAAACLGLAWRGNLGLADRGLDAPGAALALAAALRRVRPQVLCIPHPEDPHPDHRAAHALCLEAVFDAGLARRRLPEPPFRPRVVLRYFINGWAEAPLAVPVGGVYDDKRRAVEAHRSQFDPDRPDAAPTRLNRGQMWALVEARDRLVGARLGGGPAEAFSPVTALVCADWTWLLGPDRAPRPADR